MLNVRDLYPCNEMVPGDLTICDYYYKDLPNPVIDFKVRASINRGAFSFTVEQIQPDLLERFSTTTSAMRTGSDGNFILTEDQLKKIPHNLISLILSDTETDVKIGSVLTLNDNSDNISPDICEQMGEAYIFHEIKTTTIPGERVLADRFDAVLAHYSDPLRRRAEHYGVKLALYATVVGPEEIASNCDYPDDTLQHLALARDLGWQIQEAFRKLGWVMDSDSTMTEQKKRIIESIGNLSKIRELNKDHLNITESDVKRWKKPISLEMEAEILKEWRIESKKTLEKDLAKPDHGRLVRSYFESVEGDGSERRRTDRKFVAPFPMVVLDCQEIISVEEEIELSSIESSNEIGELWALAIGKHLLTPSNFKQRTLEEMLRIADGEDLPPLMEKRDYCRVNLDLPQELKEELSLYGISGKQFVHAESKELKQAESKIPFSMSVDVSDIDDFVRYDSLKLFKDTGSLFYDKLQKIMHQGMEGLEPDESLDSFVRNFFASAIGLSLDFISEVVEEVNYSRAKNCKRDGFVLTKMKNFPCMILIKPTRADKQIMFSLLIKKAGIIEQIPGPFRKLIDFGDKFVFTEFSTLDQHKISHYLYATSKALSIMATFHQLFNVSYKAATTSRIIKHFNAALLIYLEDKQQTSETLMIIRYATMEICKGQWSTINPFKVLTKFPTRIRSRLLVWIIRNFVSAFTEMLSSPPRLKKSKDDGLTAEEKVEATKDEFEGLLSWIDGQPITTFELALNLSYLGILHNKDEGDLVHGYFKIFTKVISQEVLMRDVRPNYCGKVNPKIAEIRTHEFHPSFVALIGQKISKKIEDKLISMGSNLEDRILSSLSRMTYEDYATTKASAKAEIVNDLDGKFDMNDKKSHRQKCVLEVLNLLDELSNSDTSPFMKIDVLYDMQKDYGIRANLFKKNQIGGYREIFVLNMVSRLLVSFVERISRTICELLENEMLTKGNEKLKRTESHYKLVGQALQKAEEDKVPCCQITTSNSDDAKTWAQQFIMPVFGCLLSNILPERFIGPIMNILNLVTNKRLELPDELLRTFIRHADLTGYNPEITELKRQFLGQADESDLVDVGSRFLKNRSNMMQGILHYTSSLLHASYLNYFEDQAQTIFRSMTGSKLIITTKVSSDDSSDTKTGIIPAYVFKGSKEKLLARQNKIKAALLFLSSLKDTGYKMLCIRSSPEKSTKVAINKIEEFNSQWFIGNTLLSVVLKFAYAAISVKFFHKIEDRMHNMSNLRTQMLENGCCIQMIAIVQRAQCVAHYRSLGLPTHILAGEYLNELAQHPHPNLGFFYFEPDSMCGIFGVHCAWYYAYLRDENFKKIHDLQFRDYGCQVDSKGNLYSKIFLSTAHSEKYYKAIDTVLNDPEAKRKEISEYFAKMPFEYYSPSNSKSERLKIESYMLNPGLADSFSFNSDAKMHVFSCYMLHAASFKVMEDPSSREDRRRELLEDLGKRPNKTRGNGSKPKNEGRVKGESLFKLVRTSMDKTDKLVSKKPMTINELFPLHHQYEQSRELIGLKDPLSCLSRKKRFLKMRLSRISDMTPISLKSACLSKWTNSIKVRQTRYKVDTTWNYYKSVFPWLEETAEKTLENDQCPFSESISLLNFISSLESKVKTISVLCQAREKPTIMGTITEIVRFNQFPSTNLAMRDSFSTTKTDFDNKETSDIVNKLWLLSFSPIDDDSEVQEVARTILREHQMLSTSKYLSDPTKLNQLSRIQCTVAIAQMILSGNCSNEQICQMLLSAKRGTLAMYTVKQRSTDRDGKIEYSGYGELVAYISGMTIRLNIFDDMLTCITAENQYSIALITNEILELMRDLNLKFPRELKLRDRSRSGYSFCRRGVIRASSIDCCPIEFRPINNIIEEVFDLSVFITASGYLKITGSIKRSQDSVKTTLLSAGLRPITTLSLFKVFVDVNVSSVESVNAWTNYKECGIGECLSILKDDKKKDFCKKSLMGRLRHLKLCDFVTERDRVLSDLMNIVAKTDVEDDNLGITGDITAIMDMAFDLADDFSKYLEMSEDDEGSLEERASLKVDEEIDYSSELDELPEHYDSLDQVAIFTPVDIIIKRVRLNSPYETSPFWDLFIRECRAIDKDFFSRLTLDLTYGKRAEKMRVVLRKVLDLSVIEAKQSVLLDYLSDSE